MKKIDIDEEEDNDIQNLYRNIHSGNDIAEWLDFMCSKSDYSLAIEDFDIDYVDGYLDGVMFRVEMPSKSRLILKTELDSSDVFDKLKRCLQPIAWNLDSGDNKRPYRAEVLRYYFECDSLHMIATCWDPKNPHELANEIFQQIKNQEISVHHVAYLHPDIDLKKMILDSRYGAYTGFADKEYIEQINNFSEFELFIAIKSLSEELAEYYVNDLSKRKKVDVDVKSKNYSYAFEYLCQQTKRFGIKVNPPANEPNDATIELSAWFSWWEDAFKKLLDQNPNIEEEWKEKFENGYDPNFRPEEPFNEYLSAYRQLEEERAKQEALKQAQEKRQRFAEVLKAEETARLEFEERKKSPFGRAKNIIININKKEQKRQKDLQNAPSPYDFF